MGGETWCFIYSLTSVDWRNDKMSKKRKTIMVLLCAASIFMINVPFLKYCDATVINMFNSKSLNGYKTVSLMGGDLANLVKILYVVLVIVEVIALASIFYKNGEQAKHCSLFAGLCESVIAVTLISRIYMHFKELNDMVGMDVFEHAVGIGLYFMLALGILQMLSSAGKSTKKDEDIFDILSGK